MTRKISNGVARIKLGKATKIRLGTMETRRDLGYAPEDTQMMRRLLEEGKPGDYIIATGRSHSVEDFVRSAFSHVGVPDWRKHADLDMRFARPADVDHLLGDSSKAGEALGWTPTVDFEKLVRIIVDADPERLRAD